MYDVVIIGAGLGGLECGVLLSKRGMKVCVLEKEHVVGGALQSYRRGSQLLETGMHYVGGLAEGQALHQLFGQLGLLNLPWKRLNEDAFDEVILDGTSYFYAQGYDRFVERLAQNFPHQRENLKQYVALLKKVGDGLMDSLKPRTADDVYTGSLFARSAWEFLQETISDERLRQVLVGTCLKMELKPDSLPLYTYAQIQSSFIQSAWRLPGGGQQLVDCLADQIRANGGEVRTLSEVTHFEESEEGLTGAWVRTPGGEELVEGRMFIADLHPALVMQLLENSRFVRRIYRNRISRLPNTFGMMTVSLQLKKDTVPYLNRNQYIYQGLDDLWSLHAYDPTRGTRACLACYRYDGEATTENIDLLTPLYPEEVEAWNDTRVLHRGADYEAFKQKKAEELLNLAEPYTFGTKNAIEKIWTSTSLTYRDYTGTCQGSAYGIRKDWQNVMGSILTPRTPVPNLLLTGQNLNLHGVLGTTMTSLFTCREI